MRPCLVLAAMMLWCANCLARPAEIDALAKQIVARVAIRNDAGFFAAWNLEHPGLEAVRAAVEVGDYAAAKVELKAYFLRRREPQWKISHWDMPVKPKGRPEQHSKFKQAEDVLGHRFSGGGHEKDFGEKIDWNYFPLTGTRTLATSSATHTASRSSRKSASTRTRPTSGASTSTPHSRTTWSSSMA